jgi:hypothetical protein
VAAQEKKQKEADRDKRRKQMLEELNLSRPLCGVCIKCTGFQPMLFRPMVCELCTHDRKSHTKQRVLLPDDA